MRHMQDHRLQTHDGHFQNSFRPMLYLEYIWVRSEKFLVDSQCQNLFGRSAQFEKKMQDIFEKRLHWESSVREWIWEMCYEKQLGLGCAYSAATIQLRPLRKRGLPKSACFGSNWNNPPFDMHPVKNLKGAL